MASVRYGGCLPQGQADPTYRSLIDAPAWGVPAVSVAAISPVVLENFKLLGSVATGNQGSPAMTLTVTGGAVVTLTNSEVLGGTGATGAAGTNQTTLVQKGGDANGGTAGTNSGCPETQGGVGAGQMGISFGTTCPITCDANNCYGTVGSPGQTNAWASAGGWGQAEADICPPIHPQGGGSGGLGANAGCGSGGPAAVNTQGSFSGVSWTPASGQSGTPGLNAGGGGGGGSGGAVCGFCILVPWSYNGGSGDGGGGGSGAGGNGGPSVGVALVGGATVAGTGLVYYDGTSGNVGGPGAGGTGVACPVGPGGQPGQPGLVADTATYP